MVASRQQCARQRRRGNTARRWAAMLAPVVGIGLLLPALCLAQPNPLAEKLKQLNVRLQTEHYILAGTVSDSRLPMYAQALEYIHGEYDRGFGEVLRSAEDEGDQAQDAKKDNRGKRQSRGREGGSRRGASREPKAVQPQEPRTMDQMDEQGRFPVIVFGRREEYLSFGAAYLGGAEHTSGMYVPACKLLLILDQGNFEDTYEVLFHEAFHQFMHRYVKNPPVWLNEGLAVHYGYARAAAGGLDFRCPPALRWQLTRKLIEKKQDIALWEVVSADRREFYSKVPIKVPQFENVTLSSVYYSEAYTLVHMLLSDASGRERLRDYLRELARDDGSNTAKITREYFGPDVCEHMTPFWIKHVNGRPETR